MDNTKTKFNAKVLSTEITKLLSEEYINSLAKETNFTKRQGKINGYNFLDVLLFELASDKYLALTDMSTEFHDRFNINIRKQSIDERFTDRTVKFLKQVLEEAINKQINKEYTINFTSFESVRIKDSTSFQLPENMAEKYPGSGGNGSKASIRIQFEYDVKSQKIIDLSLYPFNNQDITNSIKEIDNIKKNELIIRDLGYVSMRYLKEISERNAYYLNRLNSSTKVYELKNDKFIEVDFAKIHKTMNKNKIKRIEKEIYIGKEKIKSRMVIEILPTQEYQKCLKRAEKSAKMKKRKISAQKKARLGLNIFITNTNIKAEKIRHLYALRWQIEIMFKIWKSIGEIDKIKKSKVERFESFLYAKLIWLVINWHIVKQIVAYYFIYEKLAISPYKLFKTLKTKMMEFRKELKKGKKSVCKFIEKIAKISSKNHLSEKKKDSKTWTYELLMAFLIIK